MTQKDMVKRMNEIEIQVDVLEGEIDHAERIWDSLKDYCSDTPSFLPVWLTKPYDEQAALIDEYRAHHVIRRFAPGQILPFAQSFAIQIN